MLWENLREEEFEGAIEKSGKVCVVPIGCLEMHGEHLPVGTDTQTCDYIVREAAKIEDVVVFPPIYFGSVPGLHNWKGAIDLSLELRLRMLDEICSEIARNGFKKILFVNGHGGNVAILSTFVRSTIHEKKDYVVMFRNDFSYTVSSIVKDLRAGVEIPELTEEDKKNLFELIDNKYQTGHGCVNETAIMLTINPESVDMTRAEAVSGSNHHITDEYTKKRIEINGGGFWNLDFPNSYAGEHVEFANDRIGRAILKKRIEHQAAACKLLKSSDEVLEWYAPNWGK